MKSLLHLNKYFVKYRLRLVSGFIFVVIYAWFNVYSTPYVGKVVDYANDTYKNHPSRIPSAADHLLFYVAIFIGMAIIGGFFLFLTRQMIIVTSRLIEYDLKNEVFEHYQKLDTAFYKRNNTGDLMNRITEDVSRVRMYVGPAVMYTVNTISIVTFTLIYMIKINPVYTFYVFTPLPILYLSVYHISNLINNRSTVVRQQLS